MRMPVWAGLLWLAACAVGVASAKLVEEQIDLPVKVQDRHGQIHAQDIRVTVFWDDASPVPRTPVVLQHGRATTLAKRQAFGRARYGDASRWLARRGFVVAVPTRIGYGVSGGDDVEDSGPCARRQFVPAYRAGAEQTLAALRHLRARPEVSQDKALFMGQSFGGATALAAASLRPQGLTAVINFAGGGGGDPVGHPGQPCSEPAMKAMLGSYGRSVQVPTLWLYAENDLFFGPDHPQAWAEAFRAAGGQVEFVQFPPHGDDGHLLFTQFPAVWQPVVADFLRRQGFNFKD